MFSAFLKNRTKKNKPNEPTFHFAALREPVRPLAKTYASFTINFELLCQKE